MWGGYGFGIIRQVYNRKPKQPFAELKQRQAEEGVMKGAQHTPREKPVTSIFPTETSATKAWRYARVLFAIVALIIFIGMFGAVLYMLKQN